MRGTGSDDEEEWQPIPDDWLNDKDGGDFDRKRFSSGSSSLSDLTDLSDKEGEDDADEDDKDDEEEEEQREEEEQQEEAEEEEEEAPVEETPEEYILPEGFIEWETVR